GPPTEVEAGQEFPTLTPQVNVDSATPRFLRDVVAVGETITIRFEKDHETPPDLVVLMPVMGGVARSDRFRLLLGPENSPLSTNEVSVGLAVCPLCDGELRPIDGEAADQGLVPALYVELRWGGHRALFPIRFDDKMQLPAVMLGRRATEGE